MKSDLRESLRVALNPRSIAVIGASDNPHKIGGRPIAYLSRFGYRGRIIAINPTKSEVQGLRTYSSLETAPEAPEMAIVAVPGELAVEAVDQCAAGGVRICIVMSSGFGEAHQEGKHLESEMRERARAVGMRIVGPNSQGLVNFGTGTVASFSTMFTEVQPKDGPVGIISQSGAMAVIPYGLLRARGVGVRHSHATGNDCDVTVCELATVVAEDSELRLLMLYLEGIPDPWNLAEAARIARKRNLPIVALKAGRTSAGQVAANSHTGALASEDRIVDAFLQEHGIYRAQTMTELVATAPLYLQGWRPRGRRLVAISNSGAVCVLSADAATDAGMPLEPLQEQTQSDLRAILPGFATVRNPVDITAALLTNSSLFGAILPPISRDPAADAFMIGIAVAGAGYDVEAFARDSSRFAAETGKPLVVAASQDSVAHSFREQGLVTYPTEGEAIQALGRYLTHMTLMENASRRQPVIPGRPITTTREKMLDEAESLELLAAIGVPVVQHKLCSTSAEVLGVFARLGATRVVVKGCTDGVAHKSELGLVRLGLENDQDVVAAFDAVQAAAQAENLVLSGVIVAEQVQGGHEMMIGARIDPVFGPIVLVGAGGRHVEALPDLRLLLAPFTRTQVAEALGRLRMAPLLRGVRGEPDMDVQAFCEVAVAIGKLISQLESGVTQIDVNPVIMRRRGDGCVAVDAVIYKSAKNA
ncbi:CoA-binding protein [Mycolicibacterium novocastrense]|uniref:acetate--CoA ligase family protein n=1 Tax=Mycolicibacterium novocastrense TaxID=59813 RepID=UPI0007479831|nr:acetate--CoA ligase family protein [Mycolicibacterium novocastrense]KUH69817.1 CoA-binding protein [Mycolicibacterium novocastrense]KUH71366.1 CoA-binding protein [Mycolicibacterium novocastrense]KUH74430.1 CoA-binding protein [Mycolicibacterium novocastrense]